MKKALLVIDMQNVCFGEKHARFFQYNNSDLLHEVNKVIDANENNLVIYIKNVMKKNLINKFAPFHAYEGVWMTQWMNLMRIGKYGRQIVKKRSRIDIILDRIRVQKAENMA